MNKIKNYRDLIAWQKAMDLVEEVYQISGLFPADEKFGLTSQIRRAAISVPSNIAEGSSKKSTNEFIRFCNMAYGSLAEIETQIIIAEKLNFINPEKSCNLLKATKEIAKILSRLMRSLYEKSGKITQLSTLITKTRRRQNGI